MQFLIYIFTAENNFTPVFAENRDLHKTFVIRTLQKPIKPRQSKWLVISRSTLQHCFRFADFLLQKSSNKGIVMLFSKTFGNLHFPIF